MVAVITILKCNLVKRSWWLFNLQYPFVYHSEQISGAKLGEPEYSSGYIPSSDSELEKFPGSNPELGKFQDFNLTQKYEKFLGSDLEREKNLSFSHWVHYKQMDF